jgi:hypothetical protein
MKRGQLQPQRQTLNRYSLMPAAQQSKQSETRTASN